MKEKIGRNSTCPCGSGLKYKKCCINKIEVPDQNQKDFYYKNYKIILKNESDIKGIEKTGILVMKTHDLVEEFIKPGITTNDINNLVHEFTIKNGAIPAPLNYRGYPKSVCTSVNEVICHGIPGERVLEDGDIINVDITSIVNGYFADANKTYFVGTPGKDAKKIVAVAKECLRRGMNAVHPDNKLGDIGFAIQNYAESNGCSVVREFIGHGLGKNFHEPPNVLHFGKKGTGIPLTPGMVFTIEPMINLGKKDLYILEDNWTAITKDHSLSAQFEQTVVVTNNGFESLTPFL